MGKAKQSTSGEKNKPTHKPIVDNTAGGEASRKRSPRAANPDPRATTRMTYERRKRAAKPGDATSSGEGGLATPAAHSPGREGKGPNAGSWQPGQSGNPKGAPKRGESWREMVKMVGDRTLAEALERYPWLADKVPDRIKLDAGVIDALTLKEVVVANVFGALLEAPDSALWNGLMNRAEGQPEQPVERTWKAELAEWLRDGKVSMEEIRGRLSDDLFAEFTVYVGAALPGAG